MIKVIIGNLLLLNDNRLFVDNKLLRNTDIPQISDRIWAFTFDKDTNTGEIEFQNPQENNNQVVNSLSELETAIGCTLQSIIDIHTLKYVE